MTSAVRTSGTERPGQTATSAADRPRFPTGRGRAGHLETALSRCAVSIRYGFNRILYQYISHLQEKHDSQSNDDIHRKGRTGTVHKSCIRLPVSIFRLIRSHD